MAGSNVTAGRGRLMATAIGSGLALVFGAWLSGLASPDRLLERSYARVTPQGTLFLDDAGPNGAGTRAVTRVAVIGTMPPLLIVDGETVPGGILSDPLSVGERIQMRTTEAGLRTIEVLEAAELGAPVVGMPGVRLQLVTARALDDRGTEPLRLIFAVRDAEPAKAVPPADETAGKVL